MKIAFLTPALVALLGFALAGAPITTLAQTSTNTADTTATAPAPEKKTKPTSYKGSITAIDASSVTVATTKATLVLAITPATKFQVDKKSATVADFAVGDNVTGSYSKDATGAMTAHSLHKKTVKTPPAPAAQ